MKESFASSAEMPTSSREPRARQRGPTRGPSSSRSAEPSALLVGHYSRLVGTLRRVAAVLDQDAEKRLPQVSVNSLERALKEFLQDVRLGLPVEGSSLTHASSSRPEYGRKLQTEITDPEMADRVRKMRQTVKKEIDAKFMERR